MKAKLFGLVVALLCIAPLTSGAQEAQDRNQPLVLKLSELALVHYTPQYAYSEDLAVFLTRTAARQLYIEERGGMRSAPISSVTQLGESLVLYDTREQVDRILSILETVDVRAWEEEPEVELLTRRVVLRHISSDEALMALQPLYRTLPDGNDNVTSIRERRVVVLRDGPARVDEMQALLGELDVPEDQYVVHIQLVRGVPGGGASEGVPGELAAELGRLLPAFRFESIGFAMLQSAANPRRGVKLGLDSSDAARYELTFEPSAYDPERGDLTVRDCVLERRTVTVGDARNGSQIEGPPQRIFSTNTIFRGGEYTVVGAAGVEPVFVVVRVAPVR